MGKVGKTSMKKIVFEVTVEGRDAGDGSDRENEENIVDCIMYSLVVPESIKVTAKVLRRLDEPE